jgi:hypothetical protein
MAKHRHRRRIPRYKRQAAERGRAPGRCNPDDCPEWLYASGMARMPEGAIAADMTAHAFRGPVNTLFWYQDYHYCCADCGRPEVWSAKDQQWWYEVAKGPIESRAIRCLDCRRALRARHGGTPRRSHADRMRGLSQGRGSGADSSAPGANDPAPRQDIGVSDLTTPIGADGRRATGPPLSTVMDTDPETVPGCGRKAKPVAEAAPGRRRDSRPPTAPGRRPDMTRALRFSRRLAKPRIRSS